MNLLIFLKGGDMSKSKSSSIGIGGIIFWAWIAYLFFGSDGDKKDKKEVVVDERPAVTEQIEEKAKDISKEVVEILDNAKKSLDDAIGDVKESNKEESIVAEKEETKEEIKKEEQPKTEELKPLDVENDQLFKKL
jgi:hypothetical protein